jgi:ubiquinone/menaquinone biosynthesis C-methylase UbiE
MYTVKNEEIGAGYNRVIEKGEYENDYEFNRWNIRARNRAEYAMTYRSIKEHAKGLSFQKCLELGPGPGTWTRVIFRVNPEAYFDLVDVSEAMRTQFRLEMRGGERVNYMVSDIMKYSPTNSYDLFFSSRAVEYLDDKPAFFTKMATFIRPNGQGLIVTKNPFHGVRKSKEPIHQGQISMVEMKNYLSSNGFVDINFYPAVIRIPIVSRFTSVLSEYIFAKRSGRPLAIEKTNRIVESYVVKFKKA